MSQQRQLSLNFFIYPDGHHEAAWRHNKSAADRILDVTYYQELAQRAEAHKFDAVFFADGPALADNVRYAQRFRLEPITLLTAIASATSRIGLIATASTTYTEPYNLARLFASLDHISGGRAGWNIVTTSSPQAAQNFGLPSILRHHERYERAREYLDVITQLWDSWEDDALVNDPVSGVFADTEQDPCDQSHRKAFSGAWAAQHLKGASGTAGLCPGRLVRRWTRLCGTLRRSDLHRAPDAGECPGILCRHQASGSRLRPQPRSDQDPARHQSFHRQHAARGRSAAGRIQRPDPARIFADAAASDARSRSFGI